MAIDPQSLQILGMVLDRQQREQEGAAFRGHQVNMANIQSAQRNLENQISMNFQRQQNTESQINNLQNTLMGMGIDANRFGSDSQLNEMAEKISGSLINQSEQLDELTTAQLNELQSLRDMGSAFTRGAAVASKYQAKFDENFELDPTSDFGTFNLAVGNEDRMAELFEERGIDYGADPRERHAFIQGASRAFSDTSGALERERLKMEALAAKRRANNELLQKENLDLANFKARHELKDQIAFDPTPFITGDLMTLANPDVDSDVKEKLQRDINQTLTSGAASFTRQLASKIGVDIEALNIKELEAINTYGSVESAVQSGAMSQEDANNIKYYKDIEQAYAENSVKHINNLISNQKAFTSSIQKSGKELEKALKLYGSLDEAIKQGGIAASDIGNLLGFAGNPYLNDTIGGGFQALNEIINVAKAQEELIENKNPSTAVTKATEAYRRETAINIGEDLRTFMSRNVFSDLDVGDGGGSGDIESSGGFSEWIGSLAGVNVTENNSNPEQSSERNIVVNAGYDPSSTAIKRIASEVSLGVGMGVKELGMKISQLARPIISNLAKKINTDLKGTKESIKFTKAKRILNQIESGNLSEDDLEKAMSDFESAISEIDRNALQEFNVFRAWRLNRMAKRYNNLNNQ